MFLQTDQELIYRDTALRYSLQRAFDYDPDRTILMRADAYYKFITLGEVPADPKETK